MLLCLHAEVLRRLAVFNSPNAFLKVLLSSYALHILFSASCKPGGRCIFATFYLFEAGAVTVLSSREKKMNEHRAVRLKSSNGFARRLSNVIAPSQALNINPELSVIAHYARQTICMSKPLIISDPWFPTSANLSVQSSGAWCCNSSLRKSLLRQNPKPNSFKSMDWHIWHQE